MTDRNVWCAGAHRYDVIVIGGGIAGYNTAIRARQLGLKVVCIERTSMCGGAGVHTGCIPSKALLHASEIYDLARNGRWADLGIESIATLNLARMMAYKERTIGAISASIEALLRTHQVTLVHGEARLAGAGRVVVKRPDRAALIVSGKDIVIATGSEPIPLPTIGFDHIQILDSADALRLDHVPEHLAIVGGGAVGVEIGSIWRRLGARVTLVERCDRICPWLDHEVAAALELSLTRQGMSVALSTEAVGLDVDGDGVRIHLSARTTGARRLLNADVVLVAIGRRPLTASLGLETVGLRPDAQGAVPHRGCGTAVPGIWVVGDATTGPMSAHRAEEEAIACAEQIAGLPGFVDYSTIPHVLYTTPAVSTIGRTEKELHAAGLAYRVGRCSFATNARAKINGSEEGFVKLLVDAGTSLIVGAHVIGPGAAELISEVAVAMEASTICEDFARTCRPYPTWAEALRQAAMAAGGWMMHG